MSRIYKVSTKKTGKARLVRANSKNKAVRFVALDVFNVEVASHDDIYGANKRGEHVANAVAPEQVDIEEKVEESKS